MGTPITSSNNIPKHIHQMGPPNIQNKEWRNNQQTWTTQYNESTGYMYTYWTDPDIENFILSSYPNLYHLYSSYWFNVQRYDLARLLILNHFGGIYVDLDIASNGLWNNSFIFNQEASNGNHDEEILILNKAMAVEFGSNDLFATSPNHTFLNFAISNLQRYNHYFIVPYLTVMASTGPLYLFEQYLQMSQMDESKAKSVIVSDYKPFNIRHSVGNSWHHLDARFILWMYKTFKSFDRSVADLFREMVIFMVCLVLLQRGIRVRCPVTICASVIIVAQHSALLFLGRDILTRSMVLCGSMLLGMTGYYRKSAVISFAGTYSFVSKFDQCKLLRMPMDCEDDISREVVKLCVAVIIWVILFGAMMSISQIKRRKTVRRLKSNVYKALNFN